MRVRDKVAIVTGAARGIGKAIALVLAEEGAHVVVNDIDLDGAQKVANEIVQMGRKALAIKADVAKADEVHAMVEETLQEFQRVDILVNNAGIIRRAPTESMTEDDWERVIDVNLKGTFNCCKAVMGIMKRQRSGKIVNISSIAGKIGDIASAPSYGVSKAGVACLAKALAMELAPFGITVNAVAPHAIETEMSKEWSEEKRKAIIASIPLGRLGEPRDVAEAVLFLVSDGAKFITGEVLDVNGGSLMD